MGIGVLKGIFEWTAKYHEPDGINFQRLLSESRELGRATCVLHQAVRFSNLFTIIEGIDLTPFNLSKSPWGASSCAETTGWLLNLVIAADFMHKFNQRFPGFAETKPTIG